VIECWRIADNSKSVLYALTIHVALSVFYCAGLFLPAYLFVIPRTADAS
jgi:hypothetical protein